METRRMKMHKIAEDGNEDRISSLPDCLLVDILSRLPYTRDAIRTGILAKRWKHLWTLVTSLFFTHEPPSVFDLFALLGKKASNQYPTLSDFYSLVNKTLAQCRQLKLKRFEVCCSYDVQYESQVKNWVRYAVSRNVEELYLLFGYSNCSTRFVLDQSFFVNTCFIDLNLSWCIINPIGSISWKNLRSLLIEFGKLDEDLIENILSGSPLLESLVLDLCYGFRKLNITSKSVKNLVFSGYMTSDDDDDKDDDCVEINAPNILSLTIKGEFFWWKLLLVNVSSLIEANLNYAHYGKSGYFKPTYAEEILKGFMLNLGHVKELIIGGCCAKVVSRLEAEGFDFPSNIIKDYDGDGDGDDDDDDEDDGYIDDDDDEEEEDNDDEEEDNDEDDDDDEEEEDDDEEEEEER